jgi:hypothetical protein
MKKTGEEEMMAELMLLICVKCTTHKADQSNDVSSLTIKVTKLRKIKRSNEVTKVTTTRFIPGKKNSQIGPLPGGMVPPDKRGSEQKKK